MGCSPVLNSIHPGSTRPMPPGNAHKPPDVGTRASIPMFSYKGRWGPVEPATELRRRPLSKKGGVDGLVPRFELDTPGVNF